MKHNGKVGVLNSTQRKELVDFLNSKPNKVSKFNTNWEFLVSMWNANNSVAELDEDITMPNYKNLK